KSQRHGFSSQADRHRGSLWWCHGGTTINATPVRNFLVLHARRDKLSAGEAWLIGLRQQVNQLRPGFHRVEDQLIAAIEDEHHCFEQPATRIETEPELPGWTVLVEIFYPNRPGRSLRRVFTRNAMLQRGVVN